MKNEIDIMKNAKTQLELTFDHSAKRPAAPSPNRRRPRAHWWFQQMHVMVDRAFDWSTAPAPPPQQITLTLTKAR